ncbi:RES domain-containing protein [Mucilaginibacter oryzae]|uniref:RES domain-containing protein n=1 Tax=Mucilaginibacter oryzae TaxID=468058 RepID=A0A316HA49_9SPHI|nr:RES family NAD+ phosphorylase [Mucilaginibacter oryzae]PWK77954.1 RES domain-containing protein [Mucilaginibacter oryzae]
MILYRIVKCHYANDLSGTGARLYGGRWNSEGRAMLYTASSRALAVLEVLVHLQPLIIPDDFCLTEIQVPDREVATLDMDLLPDNWRDIDAPLKLRDFGDAFIKELKHLLMRVPSSIVPDEYNYLINPLHPDVDQVKLIKRLPFRFDQRLI